MSLATRNDTQRFRSAVAGRLGLHFEDAKLGWLAEILRRRAEIRGSAVPAYLDNLERCGQWDDEVRGLAEDLTITETYFFRHGEQLRAFAQVALPDRLSVRPRSQPLSVLSAGCASGEEPYSLAMLARDATGELRGNVTVLGIDINATMLERALRASYTDWSLREASTDMRRRWFRAAGGEFMLDPEVRADVKFEERNLSLENADLWQPGRFDIVFCRNLIMYFTPEQARRLIGRISAALAPGGFLFLGHAETLRGLSQDFHLRHTHGAFYYQRKYGLAAAPSETWPASEWSKEIEQKSVELNWSATWIENVQRAADRIKALSENTTIADEVARSNDRASPNFASKLAFALELLKKEAFAEAIDVLNQLPPGRDGDADVMLLRAVLLTHSGRISEAERACTRLLKSDELNSGAHYVLALCREAAGDPGGAADHDQAAAYLDPAFAMPRLHLGLLARRAKDRDLARREIEQAIQLLEREDPSRLLMFGGGFGREALVLLCRAELTALEGMS